MPSEFGKDFGEDETMGTILFLLLPVFTFACLPMHISDHFKSRCQFDPEDSAGLLLYRQSLAVRDLDGK